MTVSKLKGILRESLETLEQFEDNREVKMVSNTYFLRGAYYFLGIAGYDGGYIDLDDPVDDEEDEEED